MSTEGACLRDRFLAKLAAHGGSHPARDLIHELEAEGADDIEVREEMWHLLDARVLRLTMDYRLELEDVVRTLRQAEREAGL